MAAEDPREVTASGTPTPESAQTPQSREEHAPAWPRTEGDADPATAAAGDAESADPEPTVRLTPATDPDAPTVVAEPVGVEQASDQPSAGQQNEAEPDRTDTVPLPGAEAEEPPAADPRADRVTEDARTDILPVPGEEAKGGANLVPQATADAGTDTIEPAVVEPVRIAPAEKVAEPAGLATSHRRLGLLLASAAGVLTLAYLGELALTTGQVPRDVTVAGVDLGGLDLAAAEQRLRSAVGPRLASPAVVTADGSTVTIDPGTARVELDYAATMDRAADRSFTPWARIRAFFTERPVAPVMTGDAEAVAGALAPMADRIDRAPQEGGIRFRGAEPVPVVPIAGRSLDLAVAARTVLDRWAWGGPIAAPVATLPVKASPAGVRTALDEFARPAVASPVTLRAHGDEVTVPPAVIAKVLTFTPNDHGGLTPHVTAENLEKALGARLAKTEPAARDARFAFGDTKATVKPAVDGRMVDWTATSGKLLAALPLPDRRVADVPYRHAPATVTEDQLSGLGVKEVIGEFTTRGFAYDSGINIKTVARKVHGAVVRPGATFSLNGFTGPRGTKQGYVPAAVIENGELSRAVGGGISQFATTLYNAAYFAGMVDVEHREHSFYISRYPLAREATVFQNPDGSSVIDLKFRNEFETGVAIQTVWTPSSLTVRLWGTKHVRVESITGAKTNFTGIPVKVIPWGQECIPSSGAQGFTARDTRVVRHLDGKEVSRTTRTVLYRPLAAIQCAPKPKPKPSEEPAKPKPTTKPTTSAPPGDGEGSGTSKPPLGGVVSPAP